MRHQQRRVKSLAPITTKKICHNSQDMPPKRLETTPLIFLSHFSHEAAVALALKNVLEEAFIGTLTVFVSSDGQSIPKGQDFPETIKKAIQASVYGLVLLSPDSVTRPWVNIEFGAFWALNKPITPLLHGALTYKQLEPPYNTINGTEATDLKGMNELVGNIATALKLKQPKVDWTPFQEAIEAHWEEQKKT